MILAADVVRYLISAGGVIVIFLIASLWTFFSSRPRRASARLFLAIAIALTIVGNYALQVLLARALVGSLRPFVRTDVVSGRRTALVILGSGSWSVNDWDGATFAVPDRDAMARVLEAVRIFRLIDPAVIIASGGDPHPQEGRPKSGDTMRTALLELGIPADRILVETESKTTRDEAVIVAPMLKGHRVEQVVLVTSETHMRRSLAVFRSGGIDAIPAIAWHYSREDLSLRDTFLPTEHGIWFAASNAHELLGIVYYWLRGWQK